MIQANELRIGNLFYPITKIDEVELVEEIAFAVFLIDPFGVSAYKADIPITQVKSRSEFALKGIAPIPLTEEWLLKFGFSDNTISLNTPDKTLNISAVVKGDYFLFLDDMFGGCFDLNCIQSVHQLQNLYFALTGEELKPKID